MFYQRIEFTSTELNTNVDVIKNININARGATSIRVNNETGDQISFICFSLQDYELYKLDSGITDQIILENKCIEKITDLSPQERYILVKGLGTHSSSLYVEVVKDENNGHRSILSDGKISSDVISTNGYNGLVTLSPGHVSELNSTDEILEAGDFFLGEWEEITNFGIIVLTVYSSHISEIDGLEVFFSSDATNIDSCDEYTIPATTGKTFSFQAACKYYRIKYTNNSTDDQTEFRLQTILKPYYVKPSSHRITDSIIGDDDAELVKSVLTGLDPDGIFRNIGSSYSRSLQTSLIDGETGSRAEVEPLGALKVESPVRLIGTTFSNGTKDPNFWTETVTGSGAVSQSGQITISTGTTADSTAKYETVRSARKITGTTNQFRCIAGLTTDAQANNIRRIGSYDTSDGFFFQANGTTMQVGSRKSTSDTLVSSGSFNGNYGATWEPETNVLYRLIIDYTSSSAKFFVNGKLLHTISNTVTGITNTLNLKATMENINSGGNTTNNIFVVQFATILRLGDLVTAPKAAYLGSNATTILKYNAGTLQRVVNLDNAGTVTIYDNTAASGTIMATIDTAKALGTLEFNAPFNSGLTIVVSGGAKISVIYE